MKKLRSERAFTLVEIAIATLMLFILLGAAVSVFTAADLNWGTDEALVSIQQDLRQALDGMSRELRQASLASVTTGTGTVSFTIGANSITYSLSGTQVIRTHPAGTTMVLCNNVSALSFVRSGNIVTVQITGTRSVQDRVVTLSATEQVRVRNA